MNEAFWSELAKVLPGAVLGLIPIVLTSLFDWQEKRNDTQKRNQAIDIAHKRVIFLNDWIKAQESCMPGQLVQFKQEVSIELNQLKHELATVLAIQEERKAVRSALRGSRKIPQNLFLAYTPRSASAWTLHIIYYMLLGIALFFLYFGSFTGANYDIWNWKTFGDSIVLVGIILAPPMVIIHWLARLADRRSRRVSDEVHLRLDKIEHAVH
ncbi:hypothetical protein KBY96_05590 [Cyanobium sp. ATX 6A2]|uniref:hypothetical protein n=1 Tax=Cyanobium sp. ATX 6A2 TaxID=2823700 RepID=UPI0020CEC838|nr:hypothetical protein [Cyanobium sp. ATX 6A2]MCP9887408.1 hypothetical protein [Cyanobium sp. ATX 6A2]